MGSMELASAADAAAALAHAQEELRAAEVASVVSMLALCDLHRVDESNLFEGAERWVRGGSDGTPLIGEFVSGEVAGLLGVSIGAAAGRIAQALDLRHRHPLLWGSVLAGRVRVWQAGAVADDCAAAGLSAEACQRVDAWCATALQLQPWARVRPRVAEWIIRADPDLAAERARKAASACAVGISEISDGHVNLWGRLAAADGIALDAALNHVADGIPDEQAIDGSDRDRRRAAALGVIARQALGQEPLPGTPCRTAELVVRLSASATAGEGIVLDDVATVAGWGAVLRTHLATVLDGCRVTLRPVVVADAVPAVDTYEPPDSLRFAVTERNTVDVFPHGTRQARSCDLDHTVPYDHAAPPGAAQTSVSNLGPLSRFAHRLKTHGGWRLRQPAPGVYAWTSPLGYRYLVTDRGTIRLSRPRATDAA